MTLDEGGLGVALRTLADQTPRTTPPTGQLLARGERARRARTSVRTGVVLSLVVMTVAGAMVYGVGFSRAPTAPKAQPSGTALTRLILASQKTAETSYSFAVDAHATVDERGAISRYTDTSVGAYDPHGPRGFAKPTGAQAPSLERRLIGSYLYFRRGTTWHRFSTVDNPLYASTVGYPGLADLTSTIDPKVQIDRMRSLGTVTSLGISGDAERYAFSFLLRPTDRDEPTTIPVSGVIEVGRSTGMIRSISYQDVRDWSSHVGYRYILHESVTWTYSDYGRLVDVPVPPLG